MKRYLSVLLVVLLASALVAGPALAQGIGSSGSKSGSGGSGPVMEQTQLTGTVANSPDGIVINAADGSYRVSGQDLSSLVGKKITATGEVSTAEGWHYIFVRSYAEVK
jgi:predicted small secreted protein